MYFNKLKPKKKFSFFKFLSIFTLVIFLLYFGYTYLNYKYFDLINKFYISFNDEYYSDAKNITNNKLLLLKKNKLNDDLNTYFTNVVTKICFALSKEEITESYALNILNEIKSYNILNSSLDKLINSLSNDYSDNTDINSNPNEDISSSDDEILNLGILAFNSKNYDSAMEYFNSINSSNSGYEIAQDYINDYNSNYKNYLFEDIDELIANKYYTKAIEKLSNYDSSLLTDDDITDIENKISSIKLFREEYVEEDSEYTSNAILKEITPNNINALSIISKTPYLIYLNLDKQTTYVYKNIDNSWNLEKEFLSSTGIDGQETPKGVFYITNRGNWFYSEEFEQGGKYWIQFMGDYLFHSVPFDETQSTILDDTLGTPSSHGCIRLNVEDIKWLYDNMPNDTKIIIN